MLSEEASQKANAVAVHARLWGSGRRKPAARIKMEAVIAKAEADVAAPYVPRLAYVPIIENALDAYVPHRRTILREVCNKHQVTMNELLSHRREQRIVRARYEACYRFKTETTMSYTDMGRRMNRDHTTCLAGVRKHEERLRKGEA